MRQGSSHRKKLRRFWKATVRLVYPLECLNCGERLFSIENALCPSCAARFEAERAVPCKRCELRHDECICPVNGLPQVHLAPYPRPVTKRLVLTAKDHAYSDLAEYMARLLADRIEQEETPPENAVICYLPRAPETVRETGVDQSQFLASALAGTLGIPLVNALLHVKAKGFLWFHRLKAQKEMSSYERRLAADRNFQLRPDAEPLIAGKRVYLVDDVITTGASITACADLLKSAGAASVLAVAIARTVQKNI